MEDEDILTAGQLIDLLSVVSRNTPVNLEFRDKAMMAEMCQMTDVSAHRADVVGGMVVIYVDVV